ncbi:MAG: cell division protein FtsZ [Candidatus Improbicoccus pseudotrichonymphae]|uniref:Cell division protein FtsZ n=1 Tax=Candidatus Improbicoccus pseudotrichonymphae TaxID=3033792 RepID=A0AA48KYA5_9FIRM|nr:MAG: cell division protein FtsZ [Candidatus Improbicoccus pseudotrichonymphae]
MKEETIDTTNKDSENIKIKVVGVGGGGGNAVDRMIDLGIKNVDFICVNTDKQALSRSKAPCLIQIGEKITKGKGAGSIPEVGQRSAEESREELISNLKGADMVFVTAGMGGGTGTGAAPVIAQIARELGSLVVAFVTKPFFFEGVKRMQQAETGISSLKDQVDSLIVIPNEKLKLASQQRVTLMNAFGIADDILKQGVQSILELILGVGFVNLDFADITAIVKNAGYAHMGIGLASGKDRAEEAAKMAISSPLLETSIHGAKGVIINITGPPDIALDEVDLASSKISGQVDPDANIIWGARFDEKLDDIMRVIVIATGFPTNNSNNSSNESDNKKTRKYANISDYDPNVKSKKDKVQDIMSIFENN